METGEEWEMWKAEKQIQLKTNLGPGTENITRSLQHSLLS